MFPFHLRASPSPWPSLRLLLIFALSLSSTSARLDSRATSSPSIAARAATATAGPSSCVTFDTSFNLLAFGFDGKDYNAGTQDMWAAAGTPMDITTSGRPPFNSVNTTCYLAQFTNLIYILNADASSPASIAIYDATAKSWLGGVSTPDVSQGFDVHAFEAILDHDTNVFYAYSAQTLFSLNATALPSSSSSSPSPVAWELIQSPDLSAFSPTAPASAAQTPGANTAGYADATMALAENHIFFLGVPGLAGGDGDGEGVAKVFVIHFAFMQPAPQSLGGTTAFPNTHGRTASFFMPEGQGVQTHFAYVPDDGRAVWVVDAGRNASVVLAGPPQKDPWATYAASTSALVMMGTDGQVAWVGYDPSSDADGTSSSWATITNLPNALSSSSSSGSSSSGSSGSGGGNSTSGQISKPNSSSGALRSVPVGVSLDMVGVRMLLGLGVGVVGAVVGVVF